MRLIVAALLPSPFGEVNSVVLDGLELLANSIFFMACKNLQSAISATPSKNTVVCIGG